MNKALVAIPFALPMLLAAGCANYDFTKAKTPTGEWDMRKLIADLEASGKETLSDGIWIPLVYLDLTTFSRSEPAMPGFTLSELTAVAPVFCIGSNERRIVDGDGEPIEHSDRWWFGWGLGLHDYDEYVPTRHGVRCHGRFRWLGIFGKDSTHYVTREPAPEAPPKAPSS